MKHIHKAMPAKQTLYGWTTCVTPDACAAIPARQEAHGNIINIDRCCCGQWRKSEVNGGRTNYGPWQESDDLDY